MSLLPFRVLGLQQIAIGHSDKKKLERLWCDCLGLKIQSTFESKAENVKEDILHLGKGHFRVELDLMEPIDPEKKPRVDVPPLNHIGLWVDKLVEAVNYLEAQGVRFAPGGIRKGATGHNVCFIHPKGNEYFPISGEGTLLELVQAPQEIVDASKFSDATNNTYTN